jgi:hypothetical protein
MARVRIRLRDSEDERLPKTCLVCGDDATAIIDKKFVLTPEWAGVVGLLVLCVGNLLGIIVYIIVLESLKKRITIGVPVCERHRGYFTKRAIVRAFLTALCFIVPAIALVAALTLADERDAAMVAILSGIVSFAVTLILVAVILSTMHNAGVRAKEIDERSVTLVNVAESFARALSESRRLDNDFDDDDRPRRMVRPPEEPPPGRRESYRDRREPDDPRQRRRSGDDEIE